MIHWPIAVPESLQRLRVYRLQFELEGQADVRLPSYLGSTLRGSLAMAFRRMVCTHGMRRCDGCPVQATCPYPAYFETSEPSGRQSIKRMRDRPHPVVIEPPGKHKREYQRGDRLSFGLVLIGHGIEGLPYFVFAVNEMAEVGLGADRVPFRLVTVQDAGGITVFDCESGQLVGTAKPPTVADIVSASHIPESCELLLDTPLRIVFNKSLVGRDLTMDVFLKHACRRLWALLTTYEDVNPDELDFRPLLREVPVPDVISSSLRWWDLERYSNRQKSKLKIGGLVGEVTLSGNIEPWWPILVAISEVHVGKGTVMGLGKVRIKP